MGVSTQMTNIKIVIKFTLAAVCFAVSITISAQNFGGPDAVENVIEDDAQIRPAGEQKTPVHWCGKLKTGIAIRM